MPSLFYGERRNFLCKEPGHRRQVRCLPPCGTIRWPEVLSQKARFFSAKKWECFMFADYPVRICALPGELSLPGTLLPFPSVVASFFPEGGLR